MLHSTVESKMCGTFWREQHANSPSSFSLMIHRLKLNIVQCIAMLTQVFICNFDISQKLVERLYGIHKIHSNYGRVFSEWSAIEKEMADGLQTAGHYMDV